MTQTVNISAVFPPQPITRGLLREYLKVLNHARLTRAVELERAKVVRQLGELEAELVGGGTR